MITYRAMTPTDVHRVPLECHGGADKAQARIADLGSAAMLAFDGARLVGQLQFRRHQADLASARGIWDADYWGDFAGRAVDVPNRTLGIFCYHVGQTGEGEARDARYMGRGIGIGLLDSVIGWSDANGFDAIVAKCTPDDRRVMAFMGGMPARTYEDRGFEVLERWQDDELYAAIVERGFAEASQRPADVAAVGLCVRRRPGSER